MTIARQLSSFSLPKIGESAQSNQDRYASDATVSAIALSDGAGSSLYPKKWAEILVNAFCNDRDNPIEPIRDSHRDWLSPLQAQWREYYLERLRAPQRNWWEGGSQLKSHGSATFLGLWLPPMPIGIEGGCWQAVAVGDSCLFQWEHQSDRLRSFPLEASANFKRTTPCFASLPEHESATPQFAEGLYARGDRFLLATDALAKWILFDRERQGCRWKELFDLETDAEFSTTIASLRDAKAIGNDDTTAIVLRNL